MEYLEKFKKDKRGLEIKSAFFAVVIVSIAVIAVGILLDEWGGIYNPPFNQDLQEYDRLDEMSAEASQQQGNISVKSATQGEEFEGTSIRAVFGILNNIYAPFKIVFGNNGMIDSITERFGLPDWVRQGIVTLMVIAITMALVAIFFRLPRRSA
jgi:hypothetical protein